MKNINKIKIIIIIAIIISFILFLVPIKFAVNIEDIDKTKECYILKIRYGNTEGGCWVIGDKDNDYLNPYIPVHIKGKPPSCPFDYLSSKINNNEDNRFVVYGKLTKEMRMTQMGLEREYYTLVIEDWDIMSSIKGGLHKEYLTIFDLNWFPIFVDPVESWRWTSDDR